MLTCIRNYWHEICSKTKNIEMKQSLKYTLIFIVAIVVAHSCKKEVKCDNTITVTTSNVQSALGTNNGKIIVKSPKGAGYQYSINNGVFQTDTVFANIGVGTYVVVAKNGDCQWKTSVDMLNPCTSNISVLTTKFDAITGQANGSITVTQPVGTGITYSINNGTYQASTNFNNLMPGTYAVKVKTALGCDGAASVTLNGYGVKYHAVKQLILGYCGPCHLNGANSGATNFDTDASIVAKAARIKARSVDMVPSVMPQGGPLTAVDKQKITDWITAGGTINN